jgi:hypothetical protein
MKKIKAKKQLTAAEIGRLGGLKSRRVLSSEQAIKMVRLREEKRKEKKSHKSY